MGIFKTSRLAGLIALFTAGMHSPGMSADFTVGQVDIRVLTTATLGAAMRTQKRSNDLLGKLNVPGQHDLCAADDCISLAGDPTRNQRLVDAQGGFFLPNADDGNMNYDRGDLTAALSKINSNISVAWRNFVLRANLVGYFDYINHNFDETKFDTRWQPARLPRNAYVERELAVRFDHRELFLSSEFEFLDRFFTLNVGWQRLRWGESNLHLFSVIDVINPLDAVLGRQPGLSIAELNIPVNAVSLAFDLPGGFEAETFYQLTWQGARPEPAGSFLSTNDIAGGGRTALLGLGQFSEDPFSIAEWGEDQAVRQFSASTKTAQVAPPHAFRPPHDGQWGVKLNRFFDFNGGTEIALHYMNLHSRLPFASAFAGERSCARDVQGQANLINVLIACGGTTGEFGDILPPIPGVERRDPLPVDTVQVFLDYPRNIEIYGISFNTPFGRWGGYGEYSYRPRAPQQILLSDVVYAAVQPSFPPNDFPLAPLGLSPGNIADLVGGLLPPGTPLDDIVNSVAGLVSSIIEGVLVNPDVVVPGARRFVPDFISQYRGQEIEAGDYVKGYHRTGVSQAVIGATRLFAANPFGSEDVLLLLEAGMNYIHDLPDPMTELPLQGNGDLTHPSPGADGTGADPDDECPFVDNSKCAVSRLNPTQQTSGFATRFSWGVRGLVELQYPNFFFPRVTLRPQLMFFYDVNGISGFPAQNYVKGNTWLMPGLRFEIGDQLGAFVQYQHFRGKHNLMRDRDHINLAITYDF